MSRILCFDLADYKANQYVFTLTFGYKKGLYTREVQSQRRQTIWCRLFKCGYFGFYITSLLYITTVSSPTG